MIQDTLASREAMEYVHEWISRHFKATANVRSWTPYWKEIALSRPGNISVCVRFRMGGPVEISQSHGWTISEAERIELEDTLVSLLDELGRAMSQRQAADAIQSQYADTTRKIQEDDTILLRFIPPPATAPLGTGPLPPVEMAVIVRPNQSMQIFSRSESEVAARAAIRRFLANMQVAGIPILDNSPIAVRR